MNTYLVMVWTLTCVLNWPLVSSMSDLGLTLPTNVRRFVRHLAFVLSTIALATTISIWPSFKVALDSIFLPQMRDSYMQAPSVSFLIWSFIHLSGAIFNFTQYIQRQLNNKV